MFFGAHLMVSSLIFITGFVLRWPPEKSGGKVKTLFRYAVTLFKEGGEWKICSGLTSVPFVSGTTRSERQANRMMFMPAFCPASKQARLFVFQ
jgi:hypothetical protein